MQIIGVLGFLISVLGLIGRAAGRLFGKNVTRQQTGLLVGSGFGIFLASVLGSLYTIASASIMAFLAVLCIFAGLYVVLKGSMGRLKGRWIGLIFIAAAFGLLTGANKIQPDVGQQTAAFNTPSVVIQGEFIRQPHC